MENYCYNSTLITIWREIKSKLDRISRNELKEHCNKNRIRQILNKGLKTIRIVFHPKKDLHGVTFGRSIFININQKQNSITGDIFREKVLRPYMAVCIYHELGNYLIR